MGQVIYNMPEHEYHSDPCDSPSLSVSVAKTLLSLSPLHAWREHPQLGGVSRQPSDKMDLGSLAHKLLLGKGADVAIVDADDWRTKAAKEQRDVARADGSIVVLRKQFDESALAAESWKENLLRYHGIVIPKQTEVTLLWERNGSHCRSRLDAVDIDNLIIYDLKRTAVPHTTQALERQFDSMDYAIQRAAYTQGAEECISLQPGRWQFVFLALETHAPYCATPVTGDGQFNELGALRWERSTRLWHECVVKNSWPPPGPITISARQWSLQAEIERTYGTDI